MDLKNFSHFFSMFKNNISITTVCEWIIALKPGKRSHHIFKFSNDSLTITIYTWVLSGMSWVVVSFIKSETSFINHADPATFTYQAIVTIAVLWAMYMFLEWDCHIEVAKFIGCFNARKAKNGGTIWSERHEIKGTPIHLQKQLNTSFAIAVRSAVVPLTFYIALSLTLALFTASPHLSLEAILGFPLLFSVLWLHWSIMVLFLFRWITKYILKHQIFTNHDNLRASGFTVLWAVLVQKHKVAK